MKNDRVLLANGQFEVIHSGSSEEVVKDNRLVLQLADAMKRIAEYEKMGESLEDAPKLNKKVTNLKKKLTKLEGSYVKITELYEESAQEAVSLKSENNKLKGQISQLKKEVKA